MKVAVWVIAIAMWPGVSGEAIAQVPGQLSLDPPGQRDFILDKAEIILPEDEAKIKAFADKLLTDKAAPLVVVTINSMADHGAGLSIETFSTILFNQWQIGPKEMQGNYWNRGMLLLVSKGDRKARIELGDGWGHTEDAAAREIMDNLIIPRFKEGDFSSGIRQGAEGLEKLARGLEIPRAPASRSQTIWMVVGAVLLIATIVSLIRSGSGGWAWIGWGLLFSVVGYILYQMATNSRSSSGGGSWNYGGGSFGGGGSSGGGGASGSW